MSNTKPVDERVFEIRKARIWIREAGHYSHPAWRVYFRGKHVASYRVWSAAVRHVDVSLRKFGKGWL